MLEISGFAGFPAFVDFDFPRREVRKLLITMVSCIAFTKPKTERKEMRAGSLLVIYGLSEAICRVRKSIL